MLYPTVFLRRSNFPVEVFSVQDVDELVWWNLDRPFLAYTNESANHCHLAIINLDSTMLPAFQWQGWALTPI